MNLDLEGEIDAEDIGVEIDDSRANLAPESSVVGAHKKKSTYAINDDEPEEPEEPDENFSMESAPGMFDQEPK